MAVPGTEIDLGSGTFYSSSTFTDVSGTFGSDLTGTDYYKHGDGTTADTFHYAKQTLPEGGGVANFVCHIVTNSGDRDYVSLNLSGGQNPIYLITGDGSVTSNSGSPMNPGIRSLGDGSYLIWYEATWSGTATNHYWQNVKADGSSVKYVGVIGEGSVYGGAWIEAKGANTEPELIPGENTVTGTLSVTETGNDSISSTGSLIITGSLSSIESGVDTVAFLGKTVVTGDLTVSEAGLDTLVSTGFAGEVGNLNVTEIGSDTAVIAGTVIGIPGTEFNLKQPPSTYFSSTTFTNVSGTYGQDLLGNDFWKHSDGTTNSTFHYARGTLPNGNGVTNFICHIVKNAGDRIYVSINKVSGQNPIFKLTANGTIHANSGVPMNPGIRHLSDNSYLIWYENSWSGTETSTYWQNVNAAGTSVNYPGVIGEGILYGSAWIETKGGNSEPVGFPYSPYNSTSILNATETNADTAVITGITTARKVQISFVSFSVPVGQLSGTLAVSETGIDTAAMLGDIEILGNLSASDTGSDTSIVTGKIKVLGSLAATEFGADTFNVSGKVSDAGIMSVTETGSDTLIALGSVESTGTLVVTEEATKDTANIQGNTTVLEIAHTGFISGKTRNTIISGSVRKAQMTIIGN